MIDIKDQTKSRFETHDYSRLVHQFFDHHVYLRFRIHQFDDFDRALNDNFYFEEFTNISLFLSFLRSRSRFDRVDMKFDNVVFKKSLKEDFLCETNKDDDLDQEKDNLSILQFS